MPSAESIVSLALVLAGAALAFGNPPTIQKDRLMQMLRDLPTTRAALGDDQNVKGLRATETLITDRLAALGYQPTLEPIRWSIPTHDAPNSWNNIYVELQGLELPAEVLIIGAHFDAVVGAPGADDNGTGAAALLELARVLKDRPFKRTVRLVFFNLEEVGLVGSRQHAAALEPLVRPGVGAGPTPPALKVIGMVSLEMLGYFSEQPGSQRSPIKDIPGVYTAPTVGDFIAAVTVKGYQPFNRRLSEEMMRSSPGLKVLTMDFLPVPMPDMLRSDHGPFMALGIPSVMLTDTANFRNPNYHSPRDTAETIDADRFTAVVQGLAGAIGALAGPADGPDKGAVPTPQPARETPER